MRNQSVRGRVTSCLFAAAIGVMTAVSAHAAGQKTAPPPPPASNALSAEAKKAIAAYQAQLAVYRQARAPYEQKAAAYWNRITDTRKARRAKRARGGPITLADYVLDQPPVYTGPPEPVPPPVMPRPPRVTPKATIPVAADFLRNAREHFKFVPERPVNEMDFKQAYAWYALNAGISKEQAVRIYGFEAGGNGRHDVQAGLEHSGPKARAISTAMGYNQLLIANTISLLASHGNSFLETVERMAANAQGARRAQLEDKLGALRRMIAYSRSMKNDWYIHERMGRTAKGMALHALNLDADIGPLLQTHKLLDSVRFARKHGVTARLTAAELEMMNLMGDGSGLDILLLTQPMREKVPTSNFFLRHGYERNPVASRNNVAASLLAATDRRMDTQMALPGAREMDAAFTAVAATMQANAKR